MNREKVCFFSLVGPCQHSVHIQISPSLTSSTFAINLGLVQNNFIHPYALATNLIPILYLLYPFDLFQESNPYSDLFFSPHWSLIWGFHGSDYVELRLLGYNNSALPHRRHTISATEPSRLMLCKIWGFHGGDYEGIRLLGCYAAWLL
jgi:hypothetical protein